MYYAKTGSIVLDICVYKIQRKLKLINSLKMYSSTILLWYFMLLLVISQKNFVNSDDNSTIQYNSSFVSSVKNLSDEVEKTQCDSYKYSIENNSEVPHESHINFTKNDHKNGDSTYESCEQENQMSMKSLANPTDINAITLQDINKTLVEIIDKNNISLHDYDESIATVVPNNFCVDNITCIYLCCPYGENLTMQGICAAGQGNYSFPDIYTLRSEFKNKKLNQLFALTVYDPCAEKGRKLLNYSNYLILLDGSLYQNYGKIISPTSYCLAVVNRNIYDVIVCTNPFPLYISVCLLVSLPFLLLTFIVYSILPELQNMHGYTLRAHIVSLFITYAIMYFGQQTKRLKEWKYCVPLAYIFNFSFLASFFWLNVTCFDIWWTFRQLRQSIKQNKKKFLIYSFYAWGITLILNIICAIMDYAPGIPDYLIRPEICKKVFWFSSNEAKTLYFYVPMAITITFNIYFFIATTITILYQNIHTNHQLRDSESKRHNENQQRFKMYLTLFVVMGISWIFELIAWFINDDSIPPIVWYIADIINALQGVIIFIIFVCRKKVKQLLLKRFGEQKYIPFCKIPRSSLASTTSTIPSGTLPMQEISSTNQQSTS